MAGAASIAMLASAHAFERFGDLAPCALCLRQRDVYWAALAMAATGLALWRLRPTDRFLLSLNLMLGLVFVTGAVVAGYHAGAEWKLWPGPPGCSGVANPNDILNIDIGGELSRTAASASCTDAAWRMLGVSMAGWNALVSLSLAALSFAAAGYSARRAA